MSCLLEENLLGRSGFGVRAASPGASDRPTLDWAMRLTSYELPLDMKSGTLLANQAPRRLALLPGPAGRVALVHTSYLHQDPFGRPHSFISHVLLVPELSTLEAVTAWGSPDWQTDEYAAGQSQSLPTLDRIPRGALLDEAALSAFLSGAPAPADQSLARSVYPARVEPNPHARRRWVRAALHGFLLSGEPDATRSRVCILAEPGAVALLIYAVARLLPPQLVNTFWFSTYEPPHTSLRENKVARIVGGYARNGFQTADSDPLRRKGYVIDTFRDAYGPDLLIDASWPLEGLLDLAAEGDWAAVDEVRELWARDPQLAPGATAATLAEAVKVRPLAAALRAGTIQTDGLLELRRNRFGDGLLRDPALRGAAWAAVRQAWWQPAIRNDFSALIGEHLDELLEEVKAVCQSAQPGAWREGWEALKSMIPVERRAVPYAAILDAAGRNPAAAATSANERIAMLREWAQLAPKDAGLPAQLRWLLRAADPSTFAAMARSGLDPRLVGAAACQILAGSAGWEPGPAFFKELTDDHFQAMIAELAVSPQKEAVLDRLRSNPERVKALVQRLFQCGAGLSKAHAEDLLTMLRCDESMGQGYWLENKNLEELLDRLPGDSRLSRRLWAGLVARITPDRFGLTAAAAELETLAAARERFPASMDAADRDRLEGWIAIHLQFARPARPPAPGTAARLRKACVAVGLTPESLARDWLIKRVLTAPSDRERQRRVETLGHFLAAFHDRVEDAWHAAHRLMGDIPDMQLRRTCAAELRRIILPDAAPGESDTTDDAASDEPGAPSPGDPDGESTRPRIGPGAIRSYAAVFAAGFLLGGLLVPLLSASSGRTVDQPAAGRQSPSAAKDDDRLRNEIHDLKTQLARRETDLAVAKKSLERQEVASSDLHRDLEARRRENAELRGRLTQVDPEPGRSADAPAPAKEPAENVLPAPAASGGTDTKLAQFLRLARGGLRKQDLATARTLAIYAGIGLPEADRGRPHAVAIDLVTSMTTADLPRLRTTSQGDAYKRTFTFLHSGKASKSFLATLSSRSYLACYNFDVDPSGVTWRGQAPTARDPQDQYAFLGTSPSGDTALWQLADGTGALVTTDSDQYFQFHFRNRSDAANAGRVVAAAGQNNDGLAISNRGEWIGLLTRGEGTQGVEIRRAGGTPALVLNLDKVSADLSRGRAVSRMAFDPQAKTCTVSLDDSPSLFLFRLEGLTGSPEAGPTTREPEVLQSGASVTDWGYSFDGKRLAIATQRGVRLHQIDRGTGRGGPDENFPTRQGARITTIAFHPSGDFLAAGYDDGIVSIHDLEHENQEVLRLRHEAPVFKVGFSPDRRVLAVLFRAAPGESPRYGWIRLWVTENWQGGRRR